jgi:hypothetical protein
VVGRVARNRKQFGLESTESVDFLAGTISQQRPLFGRDLRRARRGSSGKARAVLDTLVAWDGSYHRTADDGTIDPGAATWQEFKAAAMETSLGSLGETKELLGVERSGDFDATNGETYALLHLGRRGLRTAAARAHDALTERFGTGDPAAWRMDRPMTETSAMGAGQFPPFPLFDRGTWQHAVLLGP